MTRVVNHEIAARALVTALVCVALVGGCRFSFDKQESFGGFLPRLHAEVRLLVLESEHAGAEENAKTWHANATVDGVELLSRDEARLLRESCKTRPCINPLQPLCEAATARDHAYLIEYSSSADYSATFVCTKEESILSKSPKCVRGHEEDQQTTANIEVQIIDARRCERIKTSQWTQVVLGAKAESLPEAERLIPEAAARMAREFAFPEQAQLVASADGDVVAAPGSQVLEQDGQLLAAFREADYLGLARARRAGRDGLTIEPMSCCFTPRPGDQVQERAPYHLIDFNVAVAMAVQDNSRDLAGGLHLHVRRYPVIGGLVFGLSGDLIYGGTHILSMGNLEFGYQFKPIPGIELLAAATGGLGALQDEEDTSSQLGAQIGALGGINWNPHNWWYLGLELNFMHVFADEAGARFLDPRIPIARMSVGLEFH